MARTRGFDNNGRRKGMWSSEEDRKLIDYVSKNGCSNWRQLPKNAGLLRCGKSCRLRWMNYLRPDIKRGNYIKEEEDIIISMHAKLGNRWSAIASKLPGRSDNDIKNHWHTTLRKRQRDPKQTTSYNTPTDTEESATSTSNPATTFPKLIMETPNASPLSSISYENGMLHCSNLESDVVSIDIDGEYAGNFWTEPFLADTCNSNSCVSSSSEELHRLYLAESPGFHKDWPLFYSYVNHGQFPSD